MCDLPSSLNPKEWERFLTARGFVPDRLANHGMLYRHPSGATVMAPARVKRRQDPRALRNMLSGTRRLLAEYGLDSGN